MEHINRIEILGTVGNIRIQEVGDTQVANFTVVTNYAFVGREGGSYETMWHNVAAWRGKNIADFANITKGSTVHVWGRQRMRDYRGNDGVDRQTLEVVAYRVEAVESDEPIKAATGW